MTRIAVSLLIFVALAACTADEPGTAGMMIVNARVIDGSGGPSREISVRIVGERIEAVGTMDPTAADTVIDAGGLVLAPGFVDTHSHHDHGLLQTPDALAAVSQGVTTIVVGEDGVQQYPLTDFFAALEATPAALNVASYAGHGTLRRLALGDDYQREATPEEVAELFRNCRLIGRRFRLAHVHFGPEVIEVATFRGLQETDDEGNAGELKVR